MNITMKRSGLTVKPPFVGLTAPPPGSSIKVTLTPYLAETNPYFELIVPGQPTLAYKYYLPERSFFLRTLTRFVKRCWPSLPTSITRLQVAPQIPRSSSRVAPRAVIKSVTKAGNHLNMYYYPLGPDKRHASDPLVVVEVNSLRFEGPVTWFAEYVWLYYFNNPDATVPQEKDEEEFEYV